MLSYSDVKIEEELAKQKKKRLHCCLQARACLLPESKFVLRGFNIADKLEDRQIKSACFSRRPSLTFRLCMEMQKL